MAPQIDFHDLSMLSAFILQHLVPAGRCLTTTMAEAPVPTAPCLGASSAEAGSGEEYFCGCTLVAKHRPAGTSPTEAFRLRSHLSSYL